MCCGNFYAPVLKSHSIHLANSFLCFLAAGKLDKTVSFRYFTGRVCDYLAHECR